MTMLIPSTDPFAGSLNAPHLTPVFIGTFKDIFPNPITFIPFKVSQRLFRTSEVFVSISAIPEQHRAQLPLIRDDGWNHTTLASEIMSWWRDNVNGVISVRDVPTEWDLSSVEIRGPAKGGSYNIFGRSINHISYRLIARMTP